MTENSQKVTQFDASYSSTFKEREFVESVIHEWQKGSPLFTLYTSGSTGKPKKIELSRTLLLWSAEATFSALNLQNHEGQLSVLCCLPVQKTGGFMQLIRALQFGWHIHFIPPSSNPNEELHNYDSLFDLSSFTPTQLLQVLESDEALLAPQTAILIGGAAISPALEAEIKFLSKKTITPFWETYGMTETASHIALRQIGKDQYFKPQLGVELSTLGEQLCIAIPALDFSIQTNDIVKLHPDGFEIIGRSDDAINSGGIKIHPAILEPIIKQVLQSAGFDRDFYVSKKTDKKLGEKAILVIEGTPMKDSEHLLEIIKRAVPAYHNPKEIIYVDRVEYTDTGKLIRTTF